MEEKTKQNESLIEKILDDLFTKIEADENFDDIIIKELKVLGKADKLSSQKLVEDIIIPDFAEEALVDEIVNKILNPKND